MSGPLQITLSARAVIGVGYAFTPHDTTFSDPDVALDEILSLPIPPEPLVLRVAAEGGSARERAPLAGDWLCDASIGEPRKIPETVWFHSDAAAAWADGKPWLEAWETCQDARWMLDAVAKTGLDARLLVRTACACARVCLGEVLPGEGRPLRAIETAEAWVRGEASREEVLAASSASRDAAREMRATSVRAGHAGHAAADAAEGAEGSTYALRFTASFAASSAYYAMGNRGVEALRTMANIVRREIPTLLVLRTLVKRPST